MLYLLKKFFSRFLRDEKSKKRFAEVARQYVAITGLNIEVFDKTLEGLGKIHNFFEDSLPNERLQSMDPLLIEDNIAMACYTRYFHAARYCRQATAYPFRPDVDPNGDLERLRGASYVHTEDNAVQYLGKKVDNGKTKYSCLSLIDGVYLRIRYTDILTSAQRDFKKGMLSKL
jgi:hypothetical protein